MTPASFTGAWQRQGLVIDGESKQEPGVVVWVQVGDSYADIRTPHAPGPLGTAAILSGPGAFAGTTTYGGDYLTWHHAIDCPPPANDEPSPVDIGHITWIDQDIIERGSFTVDGTTTSYEERWCPMPGGSSGPAVVLTPTSGDGLAVRAGDHLVAVVLPEAGTPDRWSALQLLLDGDDWSVVTQLGDVGRSREVHHSIAEVLGASPPEPLAERSTTMKWKVHVANTLPS